MLIMGLPLAFLALCALHSHAQSSFYESIEFGTYSVSFCDTVLLAEEDYESFGYAGKAPLFVQIWFPDTMDLQQKTGQIVKQHS